MSDEDLRALVVSRRPGRREALLDLHIHEMQRIPIARASAIWHCGSPRRRQLDGPSIEARPTALPIDLMSTSAVSKWSRDCWPRFSGRSSWVAAPLQTRYRIAAPVQWKSRTSQRLKRRTVRLQF